MIINKFLIISLYLLAFLGVGKLIFYKSTNPWIFGLYSLPYFTFIILSIGTTIYIGFLFYRFKTKALYILLGNFLIICVIGITVEIIGQTYAYFHPSYAVMGWIPDKVLGWKLHPNFKFINTGTYWYARDFSTPIQTNSFGFRDLERDVKKPGGTTRIALLGDSFVEALQVPIEKTAGQILEKRLNHNLDGLLVNDNKYQVLNFGVSAYGIGQSFLVNRNYTSLFKPDYVFIFIFDFHIWRTVGNNIIRDNDILAIRPAFWMREEGLNKLVGILNFRNFHNFVMKLNVQPVKNDKSIKFLQKLYNLLIKEQISVITLEKMLQLSSVIDNEKLFMFPNLEHEKYLRVQEERIKAEFNGSRTIKYGPKFFLLDLIDQLRLSLNEIQKRYDFKNEINLLKSIYTSANPSDLLGWNANFPNFEKTVFVNLKILETLNREVKTNEGQLIIVDATTNLINRGKLPAILFSTMLRKFCAIQNIHYVPLADSLNKANKNGIVTKWKHDGHFNEAGNQIFADSMYGWLEKYITQRKEMGSHLDRLSENTKRHQFRG